MATAEDELLAEPRTFGEIFREARLARGWSQDRIARELEVTKSAVQNWEANKGEPRLSHLVRICRAFDWPLPFRLKGRYLYGLFLRRPDEPID